MKNRFKTFLPLALILGLLVTGCAQNGPDPDQPAATTTGSRSTQTYKGKILGKSQKAGTISIEVGKGKEARTLLLKYDDKTSGLDFAQKGKAAIIQWEQRGTDKFATVIQPKLAKLPPGVREISTKELRELIEDKADFMLIDSRPAGRYAQSHLPNAISLPVSEMKAKMEDVLPGKKDKLLIFYCGGPT